MSSEPQWKTVNVVSRTHLERFWTKHPKARAPLQTWYTLVVKARWKNFADVRNTCGSADFVNGWVVFDAASYRVVADVHYSHSRLYIKHVFTHAEYDQWTKTQR